MKQASAFTLIELLIVVAIIAILAAIAVPNFLDSQVRSKIARARADQRTVAIALEHYATDFNRYPEYANPRDIPTVLFLPVTLTTPIAYLSALPADIFPGKRTDLSPTEPTTFFYRHNYNSDYLGRSRPAGHVQEHFHSLTNSDAAVMWTEWSYGPDLDDDHGVVLFDPTNGSVSSGDMMRFGP